ncbi:peptidase S8 [Knoellia aerolata DSM 18566]|uniref:Peptidase S8 n=1 Tax=Knoellia aerolata DSM 18566 TaxID=1385519 RepID=A0A0A0JRQ3_9MICO|nr:peptidase S8 [Knoellia aerolata DSM 18566]
MRTRIATAGFAVATALFVAGSAPAIGATAAPGPTSKVIVALRPGADPGAVAADHQRSRGASVTHLYRHALTGYAASLTPAAARSLADDPRVLRVMPDHEVRMSAQILPPGVDRVGADESFAASGNGRGAVDVDIAVLDTGIDAKHRDLNVVGGVNCVQGNNSFLDLNGHGTHVAGIAAAKDNSTGVVGVAPGARLWAVRVLDAGGSGLWSSILCGIDWVTAHAGTIEVANMSLGGSGASGSCTDHGMREAICRSTAAGVTYVVAAGNAGADSAGFVPATYDEVITVSAIADFDGRPGGVGAPTCQVGHDDTLAHFSNYGADVDLTAPGVCVTSTWRGGGYRSISGTSMASPHVAGAAALFLATHAGASPAQVRDALVSTGSPDWVGDPDPTHEPLLDVSGL